MYAIIATGGKQYKVSEGDVIRVEKLGIEAGESVVFDQVLVVSGDDVKVGNPTVATQPFPELLCVKEKLKKSSFTDIREKPDITKRMVTDRRIHRLRLIRSTLNPGDGS